MLCIYSIIQLINYSLKASETFLLCNIMNFISVVYAFFVPPKIIQKKVIPCHELSTKNFVDLIAKLKCEKKFGYK